MWYVKSGHHTVQTIFIIVIIVLLGIVTYKYCNPFQIPLCHPVVRSVALHRPTSRFFFCEDLLDLPESELRASEEPAVYPRWRDFCCASAVPGCPASPMHRALVVPHDSSPQTLRCHPLHCPGRQ